MRRRETVRGAVGLPGGVLAMTPAGDADDLIAVALAAGRMWAEAAAAANVSRATVARRMAVPAFRARVSALRSEIISRATGLLAAALADAAATLHLLMTDAESEAVRPRAAVATIELTLKP